MILDFAQKWVDSPSIFGNFNGENNDKPSLIIIGVSGSHGYSIDKSGPLEKFHVGEQMCLAPKLEVPSCGNVPWDIESVFDSVYEKLRHLPAPTEAI